MTTNKNMCFKPNNHPDVLDDIRSKLRKYVKENNLKCLVLGVSGGIDSCLIASVAHPVCDELGIPLIGRSITIESNKEDEQQRARMVGVAFCTDFKEVDLTELYKLFLLNLESDGETKISRGNVKARMRMIYLRDIAGKNGGMCLGTDNLTEHLLGFWTLGGDDFETNFLHGLWKTEIFDLAEYLKNQWAILRSLDATKRARALEACLNANVTDGLGVSNSSLDQILPGWQEKYNNCREAYIEVDNVLNNCIGPSYAVYPKANKDNPIVIRHLKSAFKRKIPINIKRQDLNSYLFDLEEKRIEKERQEEYNRDFDEQQKRWEVSQNDN